MDNTILLDTNIVSFALKGDSRAASYVPYLQGRRLAISFMTVAELFQWAAIRNWGARRTSQLEASLENYIVLPFDIALCRLWGEVRARCRAAGRPISPQDAWVAATALQHHLPLVTHNPSDFEVIEGLELITMVV
ncbi:MAG: type II toxin-antitoxin system VapC family toxin [Anaerolineae bacterium]|jgi:predicted nucleic acid-binding protein